MRKSYFTVTIYNRPMRRYGNKFVNFRSLKSAFIYVFEWLNRTGRLNTGFSNNIKFIVNNGIYDSEMSYDLVRDLAYDLMWLEIKNKETKSVKTEHGKYTYRKGR